MNSAEKIAEAKLASTAGRHDAARRLALQSLALVSAELPHLSGLAHHVRVVVDDRTSTAAIAQSGRLVINSTWFGELKMREAMFVMAHELMHLCLATHERAAGTPMKIFNIAHDYIINDILSTELGMPVPANGMVLSNARHKSAEQIVTMLQSGQLRPQRRRGPQGAMRAALADAGLTESEAEADEDDGVMCSGDVMSDELERERFPDDDPGDLQRRREQLRKLGAKSISLKALAEKIDAARVYGGPHGLEAGEYSATAEALKANYAPPWELALQSWMEAVAPGPRTFARPSRRGEGLNGAVLPGRKREGWTLHIVLDTSGSMTSELPRLLGLIAAFCEANSVAQVHLLQCDVDVTQDEYVTPEELYNYRLAGFGGSDMSAAMLRLNDDPEVVAVLVLTDAYIDYPPQAPHYSVLWAVTRDGSDNSFSPAYGIVMKIA